MSAEAVTARGASRRRTRQATAPGTVAGPGQGLDAIMLGATAFLIGLGLVLVYSSSSVFAARAYGDAEHFLQLQLAWAVVGLVAMFAATRVSGRMLRKLAGWVFLLALVTCILVLIPGIGHLAGGARRWLTFGGIGFQPSELAKVAIVLVLALILARRDEKPRAQRPNLLVPVLVAQVPVLLILLEPDVGTALVIELIVAGMVFAAGLRLRTLIVLGLAALPVFYHQVVGTQYTLRRVLSFIDPWAYRSTIGYQVTEAIISIGSGGITGVGLGESKHKLFFLPAAHTDFVFAILGEELGLVGSLLLLVAFGVLFARGIRAAMLARSRFDTYVAIGLTAVVAVPAVLNVGVATGMLPTTGLPLPLVSYGGSNLLATLGVIGLLLRIARDGDDGQATERDL
jgi:cell division protein FtsW